MQFDYSLDSFKKLFFDKSVVESVISKEEKRALGKMGAYVRAVARNSLKYKNKSAEPGRPPNVHRKITRVKFNKRTGETKNQQVSPLKELLFFAYDPSTKSTVVGPMLFRSSGLSNPLAETIPGVLERGGQVNTARSQLVKTTGRRATERQKETFLRKLRDGTLVKPVKETVIRTVLNYRPHPFMKPALEISLSKFPNFFRNGG